MAKKLFKIAISLVLSLTLWLYVVLVIGPEYKDTYKNIEVDLVGVLNDDFIILGDKDFTVDIKLSGNRVDLNKVNASNIIVELDQSQIGQDGTTAYPYKIIVPDTVTIESYSPSRITLEVARRKQKTIDVEITYDEDMIPTGYGVLEVRQEFEKIEISGPEDVINRIVKANIHVDITPRNQKTGIDSEEYSITYLDANGKKVHNSNVKPVDEEAEKITVSMPIGIKKEIPLRVYVVEGGGLTTKNVTVEPQIITVLGLEEDLQNFEEWYLNDQENPIDLSTIDKEAVTTFAIDLPDNIIYKRSNKEAVVKVSFEGVLEKTFTIPQNQFQLLGVPDGMLPLIEEEEVEITVRGAKETVSALTTEDILVSVDFTDSKLGLLKIYELTVSIEGNPKDACVIGGPYEIFVELKDISGVQQAGQENTGEGAVALLKT